MKILTNTSHPKIVIFGQGYIGLPMSVLLAKHGIKTIGIEKDKQIVDDFKNGKKVHDINEQLIAVRTAFDQHNLISALHTYKSLNNSVYKNVIPPIKLLDENDRRKLFDTLEKLKFRKAA